jgi:hypothetical protein
VGLWAGKGQVVTELPASFKALTTTEAGSSHNPATRWCTIPDNPLEGLQRKGRGNGREPDRYCRQRWGVRGGKTTSPYNAFSHYWCASFGLSR